MRIQAPLLVTAIAIFSACSQSANPLGPSATAGETAAAGIGQASAARASLQRVAETGGGGGELCGGPPEECPDGEAVVTSGDANLRGSTYVTRTSNVLNFSATGDLGRPRALAGRSDTEFDWGHISGGTLELSVSGGVANVLLTLDGEGQTFEISGSGAVTQSTGPCFSGWTSLTTRLTLRLPYLGKTSIVETHNIACS